MEAALDRTTKSIKDFEKDLGGEIERFCEAL